MSGESNSDENIVNEIISDLNSENNPENNPENNLILCPNCTAYFPDIISLNDHIFIVHDKIFEDNTFSCEICNIEFNTENELDEHAKTHIPKRIFETPPLSRLVRSNNLPDLSEIIRSPPPVVFSLRKRRLGKSYDDNIDDLNIDDIKIDNIKINDIFDKLESKFDNSKPNDEIDFNDSNSCDLVVENRQNNIFPAIFKFDNRSKSNSDDTMSDNSEIDDIPTSEKGKHICPSCSRKYLTEHLLGNHFMIAHSSYDRMLELDNAVHRIGFPGLDILSYIGMIDVVSKNNFKKFFLNNNDCLICRKNYKLAKKLYIPDDLELIDYASDSEIDKIKKLKTSYKNEQLQYDNFNVYDEKMPYKFVREDILVKCINKFKSFERLPIVMSCCRKHLCAYCLEQTLYNSTILLCPFCNHDHTKYDQEFIVMYEIGKLNKKAWNKWWIQDDRHIKIFLYKN